MPAALDSFSPATRNWFQAAFPEPTPAQEGAWTAIGAGGHALVVAPTGSGKTLSAFLSAIDGLLTEPTPEPGARTRVLYVSPLKALATDVERNLRAPLVGITQTAERLGETVSEVTVGIRSGDTSPADRRRLQTRPPDILITTPESLFLMLTSQARETLRNVTTVIIDEVHAVAGTKRGAHLALSLARLDALLPQPAQRIGLSATVRPLETVAHFLGGSAPVEIVAPPTEKQWDLEVVVPVEDMTNPDSPSGGLAADLDIDDEPDPRGGLWPHIEARVADQIAQGRSTIVFANSRRLAERLTGRLNEIAAERTGDDATVIARAHHGSVSKEQRAQIEDDLKSGRIPAVVATSSLELGIDMGAVDQVIQIESPPSVASALQRVGRAGHQVGEVSHGTLYPKHRGDLLPAAVTVQRMRTGGIEKLRVPTNPLDVLAQQIVAATAMDSWSVDELFGLVRQAAPYANLPRSAYEATLDLLSGRYPSEEFAELRPRIVWDRVAGTISSRPGAQRLAVTSGGTIPDRGLFAVYLATGEGPGRRVGELDEEMVYESRVGDIFALGATSWRIEDITHDRVLVTPAPGVPGRLPFWRGESPGRPAELGAAVGGLIRELSAASPAEATQTLRERGLDAHAADNLIAYLKEQEQATRVFPHDQSLLVERFRDELGDWRLVVHSPYGKSLHAPWALAINARLRERFGIEGQSVASDDGIVVRIPDTDAPPPGGELVIFEADEIDQLVTAEIGGSSLFASRFRECAARALLLPRRDPGRRSPLWQQRQRSAQLLEVASRYPSFPIVLEAVRECLQDVYDLPGLTDLMRRIDAREVRVMDLETPVPSPFAKTLLFGYIAEFVYEGDSPIAERRAAALSLDQGLLAELLGRTELRELLDPQVLDDLTAELQRLTSERQARDLEGVMDTIRLLGPLSTEELRARCRAPKDVDEWLAQLTTDRRVAQVRVAGEERWAAIEDIARLRDGLGVPVPIGTPAAFTEPVEDPIGDFVARYARSHGPFTAEEVAERLGLGVAIVRHTLTRLQGQGRVVDGEFRPTGHGAEWCDAEVLRRLRRRSLAKLRQEIEPVDQAALGRFLPAWQHLAGSGAKALRGADGVLAAVEQLAGAPVPASALETLILPQRVAGYSPADLDLLTSSGEVLWAGHGELGTSDGLVSLHFADQAPLTLPEPAAFELSELAEATLTTLSNGGAWFFRQLSDAVGSTDDQALAATLWELVWSGRVTNDTLAPLRGLGAGGRGAHRRQPSAGRGRLASRPRLPSRIGPPDTAGRWALLPDLDLDPTRRAHAQAELLLTRHGVLTRGTVAAEKVPGGFAALYRVLTAFEETGRTRRGYFVSGLGAAQFGGAGAVDRLRSYAEPPREPIMVTVAATDPANPFGAALAWPDGRSESSGHRPGRKAGAIVVLVNGGLAIYLERGGRTVLTFTDDPKQLDLAVESLAQTVRTSGLRDLVIDKVDGEPVLGAHSILRERLESAGFVVTPRGLRLRV